MIEILKDCVVTPVPRGGAPAKYPFAELEINEGFWVPVKIGLISSAKRNYRPKKFVCRSENGGTKVIRTA